MRCLPLQLGRGGSSGLEGRVGSHYPERFEGRPTPSVSCATAASDALAHCECPAPACVNMTRMLVTGGAGFIGANFVHYTLQHHPGYDVRVLDALTYAGDRTTLVAVADWIDFVHGDVCDAEL